MHPFTTTALAQTVQAERDRAIRRGVASPARLAPAPKVWARPPRDLRGLRRVWRLRLTVRFWRLAGRVTGQRGHWVWDPYP